MIPLIYLIGKYNVGKSNFFNNLYLFKKNLIFNFKFLTFNNDSVFKIMKNFNYIVFDTVGLNFFFNFYLNFNLFIYDSDIIIFIFDNLGIFYEDKFIILCLKKIKKYIFFIINKIDLFYFNLNIFNFFKLGLNRPYFSNFSNQFNVFFIINSIINIFCFFKKCFHFINIYNKFKISFLNFNFKNKANFINIFLNKKKLKTCSDYFNFNFFLKNLKISFLFYFLLNKYKKEKNNIINISFLKFLKIINISNVVFFFLNSYDKINNYIIKYVFNFCKSLIFLLDFSGIYDLNLKIYFKNFFLKKYKLFFYFLWSCNVINDFIYIFYYIIKIFKFIYKKIKNIFFEKKKFLYNFNNFLISQKKFKKLNIIYLNQRKNNYLSINFFLNNLYFLKNKKYLFKLCLFSFLKIKSIFLKIFFK